MIIYGLSLLKRKTVQCGYCEPSITILIAAYNEERCIEETIRNKLSLDYPAHKREIIVISDGSTDSTDAIVQRYLPQGVILIRQEPRAGKTAALNKAVKEANGEILVFSDANSIYAPEALKKIVANFSDPQVGYVTGKMVYADPDGTPIGEGCSTYMKYENALRTLETRLGSVVGVDGGIDAVRKTLYHPMNPDQLPDFVLPLAVVEQGYRVVYEPEAILWEQTLKDADDEYRMRVRVSLRAFWALFDMRQLLSPMHNPLFAWQLWSHKVLRYLCFVFLIAAYVSNLLLLRNGSLYGTLFALQNAGYILALTTPILERNGIRSRAFTFARYFLLLNMAAAHAFGKFIMGQKKVMWTPRNG